MASNGSILPVVDRVCIDAPHVAPTPASPASPGRLRWLQRVPATGVCFLPQPLCRRESVSKKVSNENLSGFAVSPAPRPIRR
ncbi:MAG: hypothetical protein U5L05_04490 [Rubrivivax sp.]|nr:hypothetical protein [Rubrivivax sp.]